MTATTARPVLTRHALYVRVNGRWRLHDVFDSQAEAWAAVRQLPDRHLGVWITPLPAPTSHLVTRRTARGVETVAVGPCPGTAFALAIAVPGTATITPVVAGGTPCC